MLQLGCGPDAIHMERGKGSLSCKEVEDDLTLLDDLRETWKMKDLLYSHNLEKVWYFSNIWSNFWYLQAGAFLVLARCTSVLVKYTFYSSHSQTTQQTRNIHKR